MDMSRDDHLDRLEAAFGEVPVTPVGSLEELSRAERARAARHFGFAQPQFRTSVQLHFSGDGLQGHDLKGTLAGSVIASFTGAVNAAGSQLHLPPGSTELFLSPVITAGSTVLEMFGVPAAPAERLDIEIDDTPVDAALGRLFAILDNANEAAASPSVIEPIDGTLGKRLFSLAKHLIDNNVDLDVHWTRPRGSTTTTGLSRPVARVLRDALDAESVRSTERHDTGTLQSISMVGVIGFVADGSKAAITIAAPDYDPEALRALWAKPVEVTWMETVVSHPQREDKKVTNSLISIREISESSQ